jgi:hypothetical protein
LFAAIRACDNVAVRVVVSCDNAAWQQWRFATMAFGSNGRNFCFKRKKKKLGNFKNLQPPQECTCLCLKEKEKKKTLKLAPRSRLY